MKILNIIHDSIVDGPGLRTVLFVAGCPHRCLGCHNPQSWNKENGIEMSVDEVYEEIMSNPLANVTFSGGEPFLYAKELSLLAEKLKDHKKNIWCYTGYTLSYIREYGTQDMVRLLSSIDTLVDGPFILKEKDLTLSFRGSLNQNIINIGEQEV